LAKYCLPNSSGLYTLSLDMLQVGGDPNLVFKMPNMTSWLPLLILMVGVVTFAIVMLGFTTFGKKIINTGMSITAAKYDGYNTKINQINAMLLSGAVAGVLGVMVYLSNSANMPISVAAKTLPQEGYTGISIGLIAMSNPIAVLPVSILFGMIDASKVALIGLNIQPAMTDAIFGIVVYGAAIISLFYFIVPFR
jgi:simple sugar transport system permease protein